MATRIPNKPRQAPVRTPGEPVAPGDNLHGEEASRVQLISIIAKLSDADDKIEAAKLPLQAAQKHRKTIIGLAKAAGFTAKEMQSRLEEMRTPSREMVEIVEREHKHRRWLGISDAKQTELMLGEKVPQDDKDEAHWRSEGFKAGLRQLSSTPPTECPERHVQPFMKEHERGYLETASANAPKPLKTVAEQAKADFAEDQEAEIKAGTKALKASGFMERGSDEPFEATPEEIAAKNPRKAIVEAKEAAIGEVV